MLSKFQGENKYWLKNPQIQQDTLQTQETEQISVRIISKATTSKYIQIKLLKSNKENTLKAARAKHLTYRGKIFKWQISHQKPQRPEGSGTIIKEEASRKMKKVLKENGNATHQNL